MKASKISFVFEIENIEETKIMGFSGLKYFKRD